MNAETVYAQVKSDLEAVFTKLTWDVMELADMVLVGTWPGDEDRMVVISAPEFSIWPGETSWHVSSFSNEMADVLWFGATDKWWHVRTLVEHAINGF